MPNVDKSKNEADWVDPEDLKQMAKLKRELQQEALLLYGPNSSICSLQKGVSTSSFMINHTNQSVISRIGSFVGGGKIVPTNPNLFTDDLSEIGGSITQQTHPDIALRSK